MANFVAILLAVGFSLAVLGVFVVNSQSGRGVTGTIGVGVMMTAAGVIAVVVALLLGAAAFLMGRQ